MKVKTIIVVSTKDNEGLRKLEHSLKLFNYDYLILEDSSIEWDWGGWGNIYQWAKQQAEDPNGYTHLIYTDGFDTLALGAQTEAEEAFKRICGNDLDRFVYSCEKNLFPRHDADPSKFVLMEEYPPLPEEYRWRFINGGQWMTSVSQLIRMWEQADRKLNSQHWAHLKFCRNNQDQKVLLDTGCEIFQSVAFTTTKNEDGTLLGESHNSLDEFTVTGEQFYDDNSQDVTLMPGNKRVLNNYTKTKAPLLHGNGKAHFDWVYKCLGL